MSYMEARPDHVRSAADAIAASRAAKERRRLWFARKIEPPAPAIVPEPEPICSRHPLMQLVQISTVETATSLRDEPTLKEIQIAVSSVWGITHVDIISQRRSHYITVPRHIYFALARLLTTKSYPEIGYYCGDRDHTTVMHGIRKYDWLVNIIREEDYKNKTLTELALRAKEILEQAKTSALDIPTSELIQPVSGTVRW